MRSREKKNYSFEFKMHVVELYLTTEVSYRELALSLGINNPPMIAKWVTDYRAVGPDALRPKRKGRKPKVSKPKKIIPNTGKEKAESEYLKQLEDENLRLRIENAYLKELRRLRLEEEKPPKNRQRMISFTYSLRTQQMDILFGNDISGKSRVLFVAMEHSSFTFAEATERSIYGLFLGQRRQYGYHVSCNSQPSGREPC